MWGTPVESGGRSHLTLSSPWRSPSWARTVVSSLKTGMEDFSWSDARPSNHLTSSFIPNTCTCTCDIHAVIKLMPEGTKYYKICQYSPPPPPPQIKQLTHIHMYMYMLHAYLYIIQCGPQNLSTGGMYCVCVQSKKTRATFNRRSYMHLHYLGLGFIGHFIIITPFL